MELQRKVPMLKIYKTGRKNSEKKHVHSSLLFVIYIACLKLCKKYEQGIFIHILMRLNYYFYQDMSFFSLAAKDIKGKTINFELFKGKKCIVVVNVASQ